MFLGNPCAFLLFPIIFVSLNKSNVNENDKRRVI